YLDANNNGLFELGETPSGGINVQLTGTDDLGNPVNITASTLADGSYLFTNLRPGNYAITETPEPVNTVDGRSTPGVPFGGTPITDAITNIAIGAGVNGFNYNIADLPASSLSGFVWED